MSKRTSITALATFGAVSSLALGVLGRRQSGQLRMGLFHLAQVFTKFAKEAGIKVTVDAVLSSQDLLREKLCGYDIVTSSQHC